MHIPVVKPKHAVKTLLLCCLILPAIYILTPSFKTAWNTGQPYSLASAVNGNNTISDNLNFIADSNNNTDDSFISTVKPIFVIKTFYYQNSTTNNGTDAGVVLFSGEMYKYNDYNFTCWRALKDGTTEHSLGKIMDLGASPALCKVGIMRLTCEFPINDAQLDDFSVGVALENGKTQFQQLTVTKPNKKPYKFVSCMSRMVAVDDWVTLIVAMETFRNYGGDLAVTGVDCAIKQVMDLMRLYEKDGILKILPVFKPKPIPDLDYNPVLFTEYASQIANAHECFYEFKESAEFISFPDWDDILAIQPQPNGPTNYYDLFSKLAQENPQAGSFSLDRLDTRFLMPVHESEKFSLARLLSKAKTQVNPFPPKVVIRPHYVASVWIHSANAFEGAYNEIKTKAASFIHVHHTLLPKDNATEPFDGKRDFAFIDGDALQSNFQDMLKRYSFEFKITDYPFDRLYFNLMLECYRKIGRDIQKNGQTYCPTHASCRFEPQNVTVVKSVTMYKPVVTSGPFVWVERNSSEFITDNNGCL